jgi:hypothetical protein
LGDSIKPEMDSRYLRPITAGMFTLLLGSLLPTVPGNAQILIYTPTTPPEITEMDFPEKWSHFDAAGTLWVFWREDDTIYYTDAADTSTWDITTSYKDYYTLPHMRQAISIIDIPLTVQQELLASLALVTALCMFFIYLYAGIRAKRDMVKKTGFNAGINETPGLAPPYSS